MPLPWKQVIAKPEYQALSPEQKEEARAEYFDSVVAPQAGDQAEAARAEFDAQYGPKKWQPTRRSPADIQAMAGERNPAEGMTGTSKFFAGMGKSLYDTGQGIGQFVGAVDQSQVDQRRRQDESLMNTGAGLAGNISGQVGQMFIPAGNLAKGISYAGRGAGALRAAAVGAEQSAKFAALQPVGTGESRLGNTAFAAGAGVAGGAIAHGAGVAAKGAASRLDAPAQALARKAEQFGIRLGLPQLSDNVTTRTFINQLERLPFGGGGKRLAARHDAFNEAVGKEFGAEGNKITPEVYGAAKTRISDVFNELTGRNHLRATPDFTTELAAVRDAAEREGSADAGKMVAAQINKLIGKADANGVIDGKAYQAFDSELGNLARQGGNPGYHIGLLRDAVRAQMDKSISAADKAAWKQARKQWAAMKTVEPLVAKSATGDISPAALMGRVTATKADKARMAIGGSGNLGDLARIGQRFLKEPPSSGTAERVLALKMASLATKGAGVAGLGVAGQQGWISPEQAMWGIAGLAGNAAAMKAVNAKGLAQGGSRTLNGLARLTKPAPQGLAALANTSGMLRSEAIVGAAMDDPRNGPEIIANLSPEDQQAAIMQFAQANGMNPQEVAQRVQIESERLAAQRR